jgi:hypothetical protein
MMISSATKFYRMKSCGSSQCVKEIRKKTQMEGEYFFKEHRKVETKLCHGCNIEKPYSEFSPRKVSVDGLYNHCKNCRKPHRIKYMSQNREHVNSKAKDINRKRRDNDIEYRIKGVLRCRLYSAIKNGKGYKSASTMELVGCTIEFLKGYLEAQFETNMSWDNYGEWHIDHIIPCASFNLTEVGEQKKCFNYINLQPLWATTEIARSYGSDKIGNIEKNDR